MVYEDGILLLLLIIKTIKLFSNNVKGIVWLPPKGTKGPKPFDPAVYNIVNLCIILLPVLYFLCEVGGTRMVVRKTANPWSALLV